MAGPEGPSCRVARPHTSVASLFAARFRVWIQGSPRPRGLQPRLTNRFRSFRENLADTPTLPAPERRRPHRRGPKGAGPRTLGATVRKRLEVLPECRYGEHRRAVASRIAGASGTVASGATQARRRQSSRRRPPRTRTRLAGLRAGPPPCTMCASESAACSRRSSRWSRSSALRSRRCWWRCRT